MVQGSWQGLCVIHETVIRGLFNPESRQVIHRSTKERLAGRNKQQRSGTQGRRNSSAGATSTGKHAGATSIDTQRTQNNPTKTEWCQKDLTEPLSDSLLWTLKNERRFFLFSFFHSLCLEGNPSRMLSICYLPPFLCACLQHPLWIFFLWWTASLSQENPQGENSKRVDITVWYNPNLVTQCLNMSRTLISTGIWWTLSSVSCIKFYAMWNEVNWINYYQ